jgi:nucleotide-binding universal stress UspA family protein
MAAIKTILCPTDFSAASKSALDQIVELARALDAELCLLHVCPIMLYAIAPDAHPDAPGFEAAVKAKLTTELETLAASLRSKGVAVQTLLVDGNPGHVIAEVAAKRKVDLVAMATHGRTGFPRLALGSVAERAVRSAGVPVLTLRGPSS